MPSPDRSDNRLFLVERRNGKLHRITAYDNETNALHDYQLAEEIGKPGIYFQPEYECVLLGADRLATLIATHGNWFDEPSGLDEAVEAALSRKQVP